MACFCCCSGPPPFILFSFPTPHCHTHVHNNKPELMDLHFLEDFQTMTSTPRKLPCDKLKDIHGNTVDVRQLATQFHLILLTFKDTTCPACPQLLHVLNMYGVDPECFTFKDPFTLEEYEIDATTKKFYELLLTKDAYFMVLCPGEKEDIAAIQRETRFTRYPFIDPEQVMMLGAELKLMMSERQLWPAIMEVDEASLEVFPIHIGRRPGQYFHHQLLKMLTKHRCSWEMEGAVAMGNAHSKVDQLKRRVVKCEQKTLVVKWSHASLHKNTESNSANTTNATNITNAIMDTHSTSTATPDTSERAEMDETSKRPFDLPPELLHLVLSWLPDTASLVCLSRVSRVYYMTVCHVLIQRLRTDMDRVRAALPAQVPEDPTFDETDVFNAELDRPKDIGFRELQARVINLKNLISSINEWTIQWSPRRKNAKPSSLAGPYHSLRMLRDPSNRLI
ncbi:hypothetical protein BC940DRAFT_306318 [Gongronella butleri]|nr:hypothetical protein BC940DRAFT_306318 [Gongronella butleri]